MVQGTSGFDDTDDLERRVARLEARVRQLELGSTTGGPTTWPSPSDQRRPATWAPPTVAPAAADPPVTTDEFELPDAETVLKWGGVALVVLAIGFALSTAISRGWIGPGLQLAGALTLSTAMITGGIRLRSTRPAWTHALCVGGIGGLFTTFASDLFLDQAPDSLAFASIAVVGIGGALTSRATRSEWTAGAALVGSTVAWFVVGEGVGPFGAATAWVAVAVAGALYLAVHHRWTALHLLAQLVGTVVALFLADAASTTAETSAVLVVAGLLFASFAGPGTRADAAAGPTVWQQIEVQVVTLAPPWALAVIAGSLGVDGDRRVGVTALLVAVGSLTVAAAVRSRVPAARTISLVVGASVACSIGFALLLAAAVALVATAVQAAGLVALTRVAGDDPKIRVNAAVLGAISLAFVVGRTTDAWVDDAAIGDDLAHLGIVAALAVGGWWLQRRTARLVTAIGTLALVMTWLGSVLVHLPQGQAIVSATWAAIGIIVFLVGATRKLPEAGAVGLAAIAVTVGKLLTVDLREVDTLWRAALFLVVGLGIMRLGFLLPRLTRDADEAP